MSESVKTGVKRSVVANNNNKSKAAAAASQTKAFTDDNRMNAQQDTEIRNGGKVVPVT